MLRLLPIVAIALPAAALAAPPDPSDHPNVVVIVSDDMGWDDVSYHGSSLKTPNIDRIGREGAELDRFYVSPICSPTRTALMTGRSPIRFGILGPIGRDQSVPADEHFLSQTFNDAGYQTFMVGKWHLGSQGESHHPHDRGFDHFYGFLGGTIDYYTHGGPGRLDWQRNGKTIEEKGYSTDLFADEAVKLLERRNKAHPVFLYLPFNAPHGPPQAPPELVKKYEDLGHPVRPATRMACIDSMDQAIGKVLASLDDQGMADDTIVIFFCDNGAGNREGREAAGARPRRRRMTGQSTLRGGKGEVLEGGIRVPAVIRWPGVIKPGSKNEQLISVADLLPTLSAAAGIPHGAKKDLDGENMWPSIVEGKPIDRKPVVIASQNSTLAALHGDWKLIRDREGKAELFNVKTDPGEKTNLADQEKDRVEKLKAAAAPFAEMLKSQPARTPPPGRRPARRPLR